MKTIEARALISAKDATGAVFDNLAKKFKGVAKDAKAFADIKPPKLSGDFFEKELNRLKLTQREMAAVQRDFKALHRTMMDAGPQHPARYMKQMDDWRGRTIQHWREVKTVTEEAGKAHDKYAAREKLLHRMRHGATHTIAHIAGISGGAFAIGAGVHAVAEAAGERGRAVSRFDMMGLSGDELREGNDIANEISSRFPSISRTEVLDYLRSNASRLGSWERSKEAALPYARALIANKLNGGDEHEMEQVVRALEGMGKANTSAQLTEGLNAFARAKAANPDYTGGQFRSDMAAASSAKYGLSKDYMENIFPILASHTSGFGNKLSTGFSATIGSRASAASKKAMEAAGLRKNGHIVDEQLYTSNNYAWTQKYVKPLLEKKGVEFGEDMSEAMKGLVTRTLAKMFSNKNAADLIATNLLDAPLVEKGRLRKTARFEDMDQMQKRDLILAWDGVTNQLKDFGVALGGTKFVLDGLNGAAEAIASRTKALNDGDYLSLLPEDDQRIIKDAKKRAAESPSDFHWNENLNKQMTEADQKLSPGYGLEGKDREAWLRKKFDLEQGRNAYNGITTMPPAFTDDDTERWRELDREHMRGMALSGLPSRRSIPLPRPRPAEADAPTSGGIPPVQPLDDAPHRVDVQVQTEVQNNSITLTLQPSKWWEALEKKVDGLIKMTGINGPGSTGKSSPDAKPNPFPGY
jgi:hypothetical protein